jgi:hypothetical protein
MELNPAYGAQQQRLLALKDWRQIKPSYMGLVGAIVNENIMAGTPGNLFQPGKGISRGEMAAIADKVSIRMASSRGVEFAAGSIVKRDEAWQGTNSGIEKTISFTVKDSSGQTFVLEAQELPANSPAPKKSFVVYINGSLGTHDLLHVGDSIRILATGSQLLFAYVGNTAAGNLQGTFAGIGSDNKSISIVESSGRNVTYPLSSKVSVSINNQGSKITDLIHGQDLALNLSGGSVVSIKGSTSSPVYEAYAAPVQRVIEGLVSNLGSGGKELTVNTSSGRITLNLDNFTQVVKEGSLIAPNRIEIGDKVLACVEPGGLSGSYVSRVEVAGAQHSSCSAVRGTIQAVYPVEGKVVLGDVEEYSFGRWVPMKGVSTLALTLEAPAYLNGEAADLGWLAKAGLGLKGYAAVQNNLGGTRGIKLAVQSGPAEMFNGYVDEVDAAGSAIYLDNGRASALFGPGTVAIHNGKLIEADDIPENAHIFMETNLQGENLLSSFIAWEDSSPKAFAMARGILDSIDEDEFTLDDYSKFENIAWQEPGNSKDLAISPEAVIVDAKDKTNPRKIGKNDFIYSRFAGDFEDAQVIALTRDKLAEGIIIFAEGSEGDKTSVARVEAINGNSLTLNSIMDWSDISGEWKDGAASAVLDMGYAQVYSNEEQVSRSMLHVGDSVYVVHDMQGAYVIIIR